MEASNLKISKFSQIVESGKYSNYIFDCDGVLWHGKRSIEGSLQMLYKIITQGNKVFLMSNNSIRSQKVFYENAMNLFAGDLSQSELEKFVTLFTQSICYNAGSVLASEVKK